MKVSSVEDFTEKLDENPLSYNFNPSIAHWKDNLYLVCYRTFVKDIRNTVKGEAEKNKYLPNHPWHHPPWGVENGYDETGFCIMKIENNEMKLYKTLADGDSFYYFIDNHFRKSKDKHMKGIDARLIKLEDDSFLVSYNLPTYESFAKIKNGNCSEGCLLIATRVLNLTNENKLHIGQARILCNEISERTEKNWSFFKYNNQFFFSYGLTPTHLIYSFGFDNNRAICGNSSIRDSFEYYGNYEKHVNNDAAKVLFISVSTPAIPSMYSKDNYIGVGHVKFLNKKKKAKLIRSKPFQEFYKIVVHKRETKELRRSLKYDYLMFFYEFNPKNGHLVRISDMFIPEDSKYLLAFPTGLIYVEDEIWIFYGDHDSHCKILKIPNHCVSKILKNTTNDKNSFYSEDINYFIFPKTCINKSDICDILLSL